MGIHNAYLRQRILAVVEEENSSQSNGIDTTPSAPVATDLPSAPPLAPVETYQSNECVVCLENKVFPMYFRHFKFLTNFYCSATLSFYPVGMYAHAGSARRVWQNAHFVVLPSPKKYGFSPGSFRGFGFAWIRQSHASSSSSFHTFSIFLPNYKTMIINTVVKLASTSRLMDDARKSDFYFFRATFISCLGRQWLVNHLHSVFFSTNICSSWFFFPLVINAFQQNMIILYTIVVVT